MTLNGDLQSLKIKLWSQDNMGSGTTYFHFLQPIMTSLFVSIFIVIKFAKYLTILWLMLYLMKTSFQEVKSRYEADNRPAHILAGSLHRKWKYVSKAKNKTLHLSPLDMRKLSTQRAHTKWFIRTRPKTPHHIFTKCENMLFLNFSQFWNSLKSFEINQKYPRFFEKFF